MQTQNSSGFKSFTADNTILEGQRIKVTATGCDVAAATDAAIGVATSAAAAGQQTTVKLWSAPGTFLVMVSAAIAINVQVFPTAAGKIAGTGTTALNLVTLEASTASGDVIECTRLEKGA